MGRTLAFLCVALMLASPVAVSADEPAAAPVVEPADHELAPWIELSSAYGFQFGSTPYIPQEDGSSKHPLTNGPAFGGSLGLEFLPHLSVLLNYEYTGASGREGAVENALDRIEGSISYHTLVVGLRSSRRIGPGRLSGELALGLLFPLETEVQFEYAPALGIIGITGEGSQVSEYNAGFGAHGSLMYQIDVTESLYVGGGAKIKSFTTSNNGKATIQENFVDDFDALIPQAQTRIIRYSTDVDAERPSTYSVQDLRLQLMIGFRL